MPDSGLRHLWVKSTDPLRVGVWDTDSDQVDGEVYVAGENVVEVVATTGIMEAIAERRIVEVPSPHAPEAQPGKKA